MAWAAFLSAPVTVEDFSNAKDVLVKIAGNIVAHPDEKKFQRLRRNNPVLTRALFPQAFGVLPCLGFQQLQDSEWMEFDNHFIHELPEWIQRVKTAQLQHAVPQHLGFSGAHLDLVAYEHSVIFSGFSNICDTLRSRSVSRRWRTEAQEALLHLQLLDLPLLLGDMCFHGWFDMTAAYTTGDPIAEFQRDLLGNPLTCYAGGSMRLKRPTISDFITANVEAFTRLNPWEMLKVGAHGVRERPVEPTVDWWAKLYVLVTTSELCGRQWEWTERSMSSPGFLYVRHVIYVLARGSTKITLTMRAVWDSSAP